MKKVDIIKSRITPLDRNDVDTDQIIPAVWLKKIERTGFGEGLFSNWRKDDDFVLNNPEYKGAKILVTRKNFGCGSSREHAPWALEDYGFKAVIASSFADIFKNNCLKIGLVTVITSEEIIEKLLEASLNDPSSEATIDIASKTFSCEKIGVINEAFEIDDYSQYKLINGLDDIGITLTHEDDISSYEKGRIAYKSSKI
ncbi:MAG: 3-isopropylmalate dehydratase small subunit [Acidimicrobiia bacterium]|nr:3-isopropylmalate dehydratase small subunit [Acidimicrobiia bacterium]